MKKKYSQEFSKLKNKLTDIQKTVVKLGPNEDVKKIEQIEPKSSQTEVSEDLSLRLINEKINEKLMYMRGVSDTFPRPNGFFLIKYLIIVVLNSILDFIYK